MSQPESIWERRAGIFACQYRMSPADGKGRNETSDTGRFRL